MITETSMDALTTQNILDDTMTASDGRMTCLGESLDSNEEEAQALKRSVVAPRVNTKIGSWNVRTMHAPGKAAQVANEMRMNGIEILGISESRWTGSGEVKLATGETVIYSGREDDIHERGVAIMMTKAIRHTLIDWKPISDRIITARFYSKFIKMTLVNVYAPTNDSDEAVKNEFYEKLQEE